MLRLQVHGRHSRRPRGLPEGTCSSSSILPLPESGTERRDTAATSIKISAGLLRGGQRSSCGGFLVTSRAVHDSRYYEGEHILEYGADAERSGDVTA